MPNAASKLEPFRQFIASERRKKTTYRRIGELLAEKGVEVDHSTIYAFVKVRSKPPRKVTTMWEPEVTPASPAPDYSGAAAETTHRIAEAHPSKSNPELSGQLDAIRRLKAANPDKRQSGKGLPSFRDDAPLDRLSEEEARRLRKEL